MAILLLLLREPLLHFLFLGTGIFAVFAALDDGAPLSIVDRIELTEADTDRLVQHFEATWRRPPSPDEVKRLIESYAEEEVYVREARALALDRGDAVVRQRLVQKMRYQTESGAKVAQPSETDLQGHLDARPDRFARREVIGFDQIILEARQTDVRATLANLNAGQAANDIGSSGLLPPTVPPQSRIAVDGTFGTGFFDAISGLPRGRWAGPVRSGYGSHLVRVTLHEPGRVPPLDEVRDEVERDWRATIRERLAAERLQALMARYVIVIPDLRTDRGRSE